ncbi:MAG: hypothetical protein J5737_06515 [Bacteroidales bacterium]|nr:hypothetical protein [Bacteroidales bacterium]
MSEEIKDPRDLNGDGKVTLEEKIKYAAGKAGEKLNEVAGEMKENAKDLYAKAAPKAKEVLGEMKENAVEMMDKAKDKIDALKEKKDKQA